jgi:hypothetical protein
MTTKKVEDRNIYTIDQVGIAVAALYTEVSRIVQENKLKAEEMLQTCIDLIHFQRMLMEMLQMQAKDTSMFEPNKDLDPILDKLVELTKDSYIAFMAQKQAVQQQSNSKADIN